MDHAMLLAALALLLAGAALFARREAPRLLRPLRRVTATFIGHHETWDEGHTSYAPI